VNPPSLAALVRLEGQFERSVSELTVAVMGLIFTAAIVFLFAALVSREHHLLGWTPTAKFFACSCLVLTCLSYFLASRVGVRYVFLGGTLSAFNTWGQLMWSEDLSGLAGVSFFSGRGRASMRLRWPDRKRGLHLFKSLGEALNGSTN